MRKITLLSIVTAILLLGACNRDIEEFRFTGIVVGGEMCSSSQIGYVIDIVTPDFSFDQAAVDEDRTAGFYCRFIFVQ